MKIRLHLKIFIFVILFIITRQIKIYGILMLFALIHELGHMIMGFCLGFKLRNIEIMPFGLSIAFNSKIEYYNKKIMQGTVLTLRKIIISLAGPLTNIILALFFFLCNFKIANIEKETMIYSNIIIAIFNLIPIYPLDGGRIIKGLLHIFWGRKNAVVYINKISNASIILLTAISSIGILYLQNINILLFVGYLWYLVISENRRFERKMQIYKRLKALDT